MPHITRGSRHQLHLGARDRNSNPTALAAAENASSPGPYASRVFGLGLYGADFLNPSHRFQLFMSVIPPMWGLSGECASRAGGLRHRGYTPLTSYQ
jgi:hypothetical protein